MTNELHGNKYYIDDTAKNCNTLDFYDLLINGHPCNVIEN